jgi:hypothetical protein
MLHDRVPAHPVVAVEEPTGRVEEMDVALDAHELKPTKGYVLEPWVRIAKKDDWMLSAGISVTREDEDDAA